MEVPAFFMQRHSYLYQSFLPVLRKNFPEEAFREKPHPKTQPVIWLLWHMARAEDAGLSHFVWQKPEIYGPKWRELMQTDITHYGTSMMDKEVEDFANSVEVNGVLDYQKAVGERTLVEIQKLNPEYLDEVLDEAMVKEVVTNQGIASDKAQWVIPHYVGKTRGWALCHFGLTHNFRHFGQVVLVRKMLGYG